MNFWLTFTSVFVVLAILLALSVYGLGVAIKRQAQKPVKRFFAPIPRPGSFCFISLEGRVVKTIENVGNWRLEKFGDDECFVLGVKQPGFLEKTLGAIWIGLFTSIKVFIDWKWTEFKQSDDQHDVVYQLEARKRDVSEFFFQFPYPVVTDDVEISGNNRVKITAVFTVLHLHPVRAFFLNKDPVALFNAMVQATFRTFVKDMIFDEVKGIVASKTGGSSFWGVLEELNGINFRPDGNPDYRYVNPLGLFGKLGFAIVRGEVVQVEAVGAAADAIEARRLAELRGDAEVTKAGKAAEALVITAQGRMEAARRDALAQRILNEQGAGYFASLPGGARMFAAAQVGSKDSHVTTWVEGKEVDTTLPLFPAPPRPEEPEKINPSS